MHSKSARAIYTRDQITKYFERVNFPTEKRRYSVADLGSDDALDYLALLQKHQLAAVPFENLSLHYSYHRRISIQPLDLFNKIVAENNNRGGYCLEQNAFFATLLHSLGFNVYSGGGRVYENGGWTGWSHMVVFITIGETKYVVDVGHGPYGQVVPMALDHSGTVYPQLRPASVRHQWRNVLGSTDPNQRLWVYEFRQDEKSEWGPRLCYTEQEYMPNDFAVMNHHCSTNCTSWFTTAIIVEKKLLDDAGELIGTVLLMNNIIKWRVHGKKLKEIELKTEEERMKALEEHFGIKFGQAERNSIKGMVSEIK
jgi:arylamine N-acetyltransferase